MAIGDVNGDGKSDLVSVNTGANTISVPLGTGSGSFGPKTDVSVGAVAIGDLNGDGIPDLAVVNVNADTVSVLLGGGDGSVGAKTDFGSCVAFVTAGLKTCTRDCTAFDLTVRLKPDTTYAHAKSGERSNMPTSRS